VYSVVNSSVPDLMKSLITFLFLSGVLLMAANEAPLIARILKAADKSVDGKLTLAEHLPLDVQARHHGEEHFKTGDANTDGFIAAAEFPAALHKQTWFAILSEGVDPCFTRLDANQDGKLDASVYRKISRMGGHAEQHFKGADADKDGFLNMAEFAAHAEARLKTVEEGIPKKKKADGTKRSAVAHFDFYRTLAGGAGRDTLCAASEAGGAVLHGRVAVERLLDW